MGEIRVTEEYIEFNNKQFLFSTLSLINITKVVNKDKNEIYAIDAFDRTKANEKIGDLAVLANSGERFIELLTNNAAKKGVKCTNYKRPEPGNLCVAGLLVFLIIGVASIFHLLSQTESGDFSLPPSFIVIMVISLICFIYGICDWSGKEKNLYKYYLNVERNIEQYQKDQAKRAEEIKIEKYLAENKSPESWNPYIAKPCPHCGHYKVRAATWDDKKMSVAFWGVHSQKIGKRYKCDNCGNMWN